MAPDLQMMAPAAAPPPGAVGPPPAYPGAAPPPGGYPGAPPPGPPPAAAAQAGGAAGPHAGRWIDPAAFAATAPPPTPDEHEAGAQAAVPHPVQQPPAASSSAPAPLAPAQEAAQPQPDAGPPREAAAPPGAAQPSETPQPVDAPAEPSPQAEPSAGAAAAAAQDPEEVASDAPRVLAGFLVSYEEAERGLFWPIYQGRNSIGRAGAAEGLDIEIDHATTSSQHAAILASARPARLKLEDLGSTNGTFLGGEKLSCEVKHELSDGAEVRFGGYPVIIKII